MICPSCHQQAISLLSYTFSLKGVPFKQSMNGYVQCHQCGALLRGKLLKRFYLLPIAVVLLLLAAYSLLLPEMISLVGGTVPAYLFLGSVSAAGFGGSYFEWKTMRVDTVETE